MRDTFDARNNLDENNNPAGGMVRGIGLSIDWQNGPLGRDGDPQPPNGAFVETVLHAAKQRIEFYQESNGRKFACLQNAIAITKIKEALYWLDDRTREREERKVEGTHTA